MNESLQKMVVIASTIIGVALIACYGYIYQGDLSRYQLEQSSNPRVCYKIDRKTGDAWMIINGESEQVVPSSN